MIENFDKLTEELKKGDKKNAAAASGMWTMVYSVVKGIPAAVGTLAGSRQARDFAGLLNDPNRLCFQALPGRKPGFFVAASSINWGVL